MKFVVLETDPVVCMDVESMLDVYFPKSTIIVSSAASEFCAIISDSDANTVLIVKQGLLKSDQHVHKTVKIAADRGSQVILFGRTEAVDFPARFIDIPFTTEQLIAVINGPSDVVVLDAGQSINAAESSNGHVD